MGGGKKKGWDSPYLHPKRVADSSQKLHVGTVQLACALTHTKHVGRAVIPATRVFVFVNIKTPWTMCSSTEEIGCFRKYLCVYVSVVKNLENL